MPSDISSGGRIWSTRSLATPNVMVDLDVAAILGSTFVCETELAQVDFVFLATAGSPGSPTAEREGL
jgi:hypothetical protein